MPYHDKSNEKKSVQRQKSRFQNMVGAGLGCPDTLKIPVFVILIELMHSVVTYEKEPHCKTTGVLTGIYLLFILILKKNN